MIFPISRFNFNINFKIIIKEFFLSYFFNSEEKLNNQIENKLKFYFPNSKFYFSSFGRTSFYILLKNLRVQTNKNKIIINSFTLFEMINTIIYAGFEPILIDFKSSNFKSNFKEVIKDNKDNLAAITITHFNGFNDDIISVKKIISEINEKIIIIEDTAVGFGSKNNQKFSGNFGDYSILSFNIMKNITSLTGGVLIENNPKIKIDPKISRLKKENFFNIFKKIIFVLFLMFLNSKYVFFLFFKFIKYAKKKKINFFLKKYRTDFKLSIKDKMPEEFLFDLSLFQKKILISQFEDINLKQDERIKKAKYYYMELKLIKELDFPQIDFNSKNVFIDFPILVKNFKGELNLFLMNKNIDIKDYYYTNCGENEIYSKYNFNKVNNSNNIASEILMLPVGKNINKKYQDKIILEIKNFFKDR